MVRGDEVARSPLPDRDIQFRVVEKPISFTLFLTAPDPTHPHDLSPPPQVEHGPLSVLMNAQSLQFYKSGIYSPEYCDPTYLDHAVLLVGFGSDNDAGGDYWVVSESGGVRYGGSGERPHF